jgi:hypothetical protein
LPSEKRCSIFVSSKTRRNKMSDKKNCTNYTKFMIVDDDGEFLGDAVIVTVPDDTFVYIVHKEDAERFQELHEKITSGMYELSPDEIEDIQEEMEQLEISRRHIDKEYSEYSVIPL